MRLLRPLLLLLLIVVAADAGHAAAAAYAPPARPPVAAPVSAAAYDGLPPAGALLDSRHARQLRVAERIAVHSAALRGAPDRARERTRGTAPTAHRRRNVHEEIASPVPRPIARPDSLAGTPPHHPPPASLAEAVPAVPRTLALRT